MLVVRHVAVRPWADGRRRRNQVSTWPRHHRDFYWGPVCFILSGSFGHWRDFGPDTLAFSVTAPGLPFRVLPLSYFGNLFPSVSRDPEEFSTLRVEKSKQQNTFGSCAWQSGSSEGRERAFLRGQLLVEPPDGFVHCTQGDYSRAC